MPARLSATGEARPVDHHEGGARFGRPVRGRRGFKHGGPAVRAVRVGEGDMDHGPFDVVDRVRAAPGSIDDLVGYDQMPRPEFWSHRADGARAQNLTDADRPQSPQVGPVVNPVRWVAVVPAVPG